MKTKLYIGLICDELNLASITDEINASLQSFISILLTNTQVDDIASLPFEPVLLTNLATSIEHVFHDEANKLGLITEVVQSSLITDTRQLNSSDNYLEWQSFLINKCNVIIAVRNNDISSAKNSMVHTIIDHVMYPENHITEQSEYFVNSDEFLPFLYEIKLSENEVIANLVRDNEENIFNSFIGDFSNISSELNSASIQYVDNTLRDKLATDKKEDEVSLAGFYDFSCKFDALAGKHQAKSNFGFWVLFSLTLVLGASFLLYAKVFTHSPWLLIVYLIAYTGGIFTFYKMKKKASLKKHLVYRLCAEALRLKLFQLVSYSGNKTKAFQFEKQISMANVNTQWIAHMVRAFPLHKVKDELLPAERKDIILSHLIGEQLHYFKLKLHGKKDQKSNNHKPKLDGLEKLLHRFSKTELSIVVFCTLLMLVVTLTAFKVGVFYKLYPVKHIMMFLIGFLPLVGLAFEQLVFNFALEENEMRYHHQISKFKSIKRWLSATESESTTSKITNQLCIECVQENFNWYTTRVNRQHKPASGG
jgi:hypothetical protein